MKPAVVAVAQAVLLADAASATDLLLNETEAAGATPSDLSPAKRAMATFGVFLSVLERERAVR